MDVLWLFIILLLGTGEGRGHFLSTQLYLLRIILHAFFFVHPRPFATSENEDVPAQAPEEASQEVPRPAEGIWFRLRRKIEHSP